MSLFDSKRVVAVGGGHGLGRLLAALSEFGCNATGIVATTDNGGSTGIIRDNFGGIAWGDTRNCINQLITEPSISSMMFEYRFKGRGDLHGHNLGNLMLTALDNLSVRPLEAINLIRGMLKVDVNIIPMSEHPSDLTALTTKGAWITGETSVDVAEEDLLRLDLDPSVPATKEAVEAIEHADCIVLGPGSFLTSIMPPLLLPELSRALEQNRQAKLIFVENLSPEYGPAGRMTLEQKITWCERAMHGRKLDIILGQDPHPEIEDKWNFVTTPLASSNRDWRHDRDKLKQAIISLM
ncbi:uridine diphosphate-N-acetylglucosamine-binding protein YvcK [Vibrio hippocampi]|uniref:Putative gluconeogenesis factor n=1 Tax=Vibrio hippocampi TaxID=654686 RepID=A0ABM8ZGY8_9VIBR|nr:uridine diphosphate-N-acetylglucosamine-binding protein YvcK [Vibrio hippocampi]CAH0525531.1 Putative gluconeogenesis factor [Vibrio hippocampi]